VASRRSIPDRVVKMMEAHGAIIEPIKGSPGAFRVLFNELPVATFNKKGEIESSDEKLVVAWIALFHYNRLTTEMREYRGPDAMGFRVYVRELVPVKPLLDVAASAGFRVEDKGGLMWHTYALRYPVLGEVALLRVARGTSHVATVEVLASDALRLFAILGYLGGAISADQMDFGQPW
jgi:hypothetical protein